MSIAPPIASNRASSEPNPMWPSATYCATIAESKPVPSSAIVMTMRFALARQADADLCGLRMLADIGQQFACRPVQQRLGLRLAHIVELGLHGQIGARLELAQQFSHAGVRPELGQHLGVQVCNGRAQSVRGFLHAE